LGDLLALIAESVTDARLLLELSRLAQVTFNNLDEVTPYLSNPGFVQAVGIQANRSKWSSSCAKVNWYLCRSVLSVFIPDRRKISGQEGRPPPDLIRALSRSETPTSGQRVEHPPGHLTF
jgi:hypothetical protein